MSGWLEEVAALPAATRYSLPIIRDHVPQFLDRLAETLDSDEIPTKDLEESIANHAKDRYEHGYDIREVVSEYQVLRRKVLDVYATKGNRTPTEAPAAISPLTVLNELIDLAIGSSVDAFSCTEIARARDS